MRQVSFRNDVLPLKDKLYRLALRITLDTAEAEDIVQDTLIKVWERRAQWAEIASIEAFSFTICRNLALDRIRRVGFHSEPIDSAEADRLDTAVDTVKAVDQRDKLRVVEQLVNSLPEKQRSCLQLRDFEGMPYKEIAAALGISEQQVKVNIFRGRQTIKQRFEQVDKYGL